MPTTLQTSNPSGQTTIGIPSERGAQLRALASKRGVSVVELIESVIHKAIEDEEIPDEMDGFMAMLDDDVVFLSMGGVVLPAASPMKARVLATVLKAAAGKPDERFDFRILDGKGIAFKLDENPDHTATVTTGRVGRGVVVKIETFVRGEPGPGTRMVTTPSILLDYARIIEREFTAG